LRVGGAVLYVGKATSLRQRVSGHFHGGAGLHERALEMLTQAREVSWRETETALEAALLEADEIKEMAPPFNVALSANGRAVWFASPDLRDLQDRPDAVHEVGPLVSRAPIEALSALRAALADGSARAARGLRSRALGVDPAYAPGSECFADGATSFLHEHAPDPDLRSLLRLGARLWAARLAARPSGTGKEDPMPEGPLPETTRRLAWDRDRVKQALEETVVRAAHALRRARWLCRLSECAIAWTEPGGSRLRLLLIRDGRVDRREDLDPGSPLPVPPGCVKTPAERRAAFDVATFDRLRVLTTELRRLAVEADAVELRFGPHALLSRRRLQAVLRWV